MREPDEPAPESIEAAYDRLAQPLHRYALMILASPAGAEDVVQRVFLAVMAQAVRSDSIDSMDGYLRRAVRNECYSLLRSPARRSTELVDGQLLELTDMLRGMWPTLLNLEQVLLTRPATDSPSLATVQRLLAESFPDDVLTQTYQEQRVRAIAGAARELGRRYGGIRVSGISDNVPFGFGLLRRPWRAHQLHSALLGYEALVAATKTPWPHRIEAICNELTRHFGVAAVYHNDWDFLAIAAPRVATVAVAAERFRLDHAGAWPGSIAELVPRYLEVPPIDPFSGEPIKLVPSGQEVRIYTIGPDRKDDGSSATGLTPPSRVEPFVGDIGFVLGR